MPIKIISAGAGSGKTYRLTKELVSILSEGKVRASGIIATTFTKKAAAELQERVRIGLLEAGMTDAANDLADALIGTVNGVGVKLLKRFAFEAGISPEVDIMAEEDQQTMFNQALSMVLTNEVMEEADRLVERLGLDKKAFGEPFDWRKIIRQLTEIARGNDFSLEILEKSKIQSFQTFLPLLSPLHSRFSASEMNQELLKQLEQTIQALDEGTDATKKTQDVLIFFRQIHAELQLRKSLNWHQWAKISKQLPAVGAKSKDKITDLIDFAAQFDAHPDFHHDVQAFINLVFEAAAAALKEFEQYKKRRGLIDYIDMETLVKRLLRNPNVRQVLAAEIDLLLVDEFQDTSPLQLDLFLTLSDLVKDSIWVGDPKQSIYGFRGAEPALMQAIIAHAGGVKAEDILSSSWRSRPDLVYLSNAIFTKAFSQMPIEQVALQPQRSDSPEHSPAIRHWHFESSENTTKTSFGKPWLERSLANAIRQFLEQKIMVVDKNTKQSRPVQPCDIAILCKTNFQCAEIAAALHHAGLQASIARTGLLETPEAKLVLASLRFILNRYDSLSIAEILLLAAKEPLEEIIESRLDYLELLDADEKPDIRWAEDNFYIQKLNVIRRQAVELSATEILFLLLEELNIRRIVVAWGNAEQRLDNLEQLRKYASDYENNCQRLHSAATLGGLLLWLNQLAAKDEDEQAASENPAAVQVLTYHKSKGLEWAVVVCHDLEATLRDDVWGLSLVQEREEVDLADLLGGRWLRYWVNPLSDQIGKTMLEERIAASSEQQQKHEQALAEDARLLYVGFTRARDYLILPTRKPVTNWLNRVFSGNEAAEVLDANQSETPFEWNGNYLIKQTDIFDFPKEIEPLRVETEDIWVIEEL